jgi:protein phosphatase-4 regulatory subunit 3
MLSEARNWDDQGTGHVSSAYVEKLEGMSLLVRSEEDGEFYLSNIAAVNETSTVWGRG